MLGHIWMRAAKIIRIQFLKFFSEYPMVTSRLCCDKKDPEASELGLIIFVGVIPLKRPYLLGLADGGIKKLHTKYSFFMMASRSTCAMQRGAVALEKE